MHESGLNIDFARETVNSNFRYKSLSEKAGKEIKRSKNLARWHQF